MFLAQLYAFLVAHHHPLWAHELFTGQFHPAYGHILSWAHRHGFVYHP